MTPQGSANLPLKGAQILHRVAHLRGFGPPEGGNDAMLDGHVEFRRFKKIVIRTDGGPTF